MITGSNIHVHIKERDSASWSCRSLEPLTYMENFLFQELQRKQILTHTMAMFSPLTSHNSAPVSTKHIMTARNKAHRIFRASIFHIVSLYIAGTIFYSDLGNITFCISLHDSSNGMFERANTH